MTINQQIESILKHPFFNFALQKFGSGDDKELRHLFFEIIFHTYEKTTLNSAKTYSRYRWLNTCDTLAEIRNTAPPENLDLRLPIPDKKAILSIPKADKKKPTVKIRHIITNQLNLFIQIA